MQRELGGVYGDRKREGALYNRRGKCSLSLGGGGATQRWGSRNIRLPEKKAKQAGPAWKPENVCLEPVLCGDRNTYDTMKGHLLLLFLSLSSWKPIFHLWLRQSSLGCKEDFLLDTVVYIRRVLLTTDCGICARGCCPDIHVSQMVSGRQKSAEGISCMPSCLPGACYPRRKQGRLQETGYLVQTWRERGFLRRQEIYSDAPRMVRNYTCHFSIAVMKHCVQGNVRRRGWSVVVPEGGESVMAWKTTASSRQESWSWAARTESANSNGFKLSEPAPRDKPPQQGQTTQASPDSTTNERHNLQTSQTTGISVKPPQELPFGNGETGRCSRNSKQC